MKKVMLAALLLALAVPATAATLAGRVVGVSDGDTVTVLTAQNPQYKVRLSGVDANLEQVHEGSAWVNTQYLRELPPENRKLYLEAQHQARFERRGLWRDSAPEPPW